MFFLVYSYCFPDRTNNVLNHWTVKRATNLA
jgi:hypothetical protein